MLFRKPILDGIAAGRVTLAFRRWARPASKAGGRQRTRVGVLRVEAVDPVDADALTDEDARQAGYPTLEALRRTLPGDEPLWRIRFRLEGPDPRIALREDDVRKLKELGLTESLDVGYRLSPRGRAFLG